jgi:hypothetical protein
MNMNLLYIVSFFLAFYTICAVVASISLEYAAPVLPAPWLIPAELTYRTIIFSFLAALIPLVNMLIAACGIIFMILSTIVGIVNITMNSKWLDGKPFDR